MCPYSMVALLGMPMLCAVSCISSHCAVVALSSQICALNVSSKISALMEMSGGMSPDNLSQTLAQTLAETYVQTLASKDYLS